VTVARLKILTRNLLACRSPYPMMTPRNLSESIGWRGAFKLSSHCVNFFVVYDLIDGFKDVTIVVLRETDVRGFS
jgi:hypothetical protein